MVHQNTHNALGINFAFYIFTSHSIDDYNRLILGANHQSVTVAYQFNVEHIIELIRWQSDSHMPFHFIPHQFYIQLTHCQNSKFTFYKLKFIKKCLKINGLNMDYSFGSR